MRTVSRETPLWVEQGTRAGENVGYLQRGRRSPLVWAVRGMVAGVQARCGGRVELHNFTPVFPALPHVTRA